MNVLNKLIRYFEEDTLNCGSEEHVVAMKASIAKWEAINSVVTVEEAIEVAMEESVVEEGTDKELIKVVDGLKADLKEAIMLERKKRDNGDKKAVRALKILNAFNAQVKALNTPQEMLEAFQAFAAKHK